jgi:hypothetical protein
MLGGSDFDEAVRQALRIRPRYGNKKVGRTPLRLRAEPPHLAEIDNGQFPVCPDQEIPRMWVRVLKTMLEGWF